MNEISEIVVFIIIQISIYKIEFYGYSKKGKQKSGKNDHYRINGFELSQLIVDLVRQKTMAIGIEKCVPFTQCIDWA